MQSLKNEPIMGAGRGGGHSMAPPVKIWLKIVHVSIGNVTLNELQSIVANWLLFEIFMNRLNVKLERTFSGKFLVTFATNKLFDIFMNRLNV